MKLDPELQSILLDVATLQRRIDMGGTAITTPEQQELERLQKELDSLRTAASSAQMAVDDMELEILRIQEDERKLQRRDQDNRKQLQAELDPEKRKDIEHDRYATKSRIADLMSELKEAHNEIAALRNNRDAHGARLDELEKKVEAAQRAADAANEAASHLEDPEAHLEGLRAKLPDDILTAYDQQRDENDVGAAFFNSRVCGGCFIAATPTERMRINGAEPEEVPQCDNCGSYLIRQSGT